MVPRLSNEFPGSAHVAEVDLSEATDRQIWEFAREHGYAILSKDSDFRQLAFLLGPPPKAMGLRVGNASTSDILAILREQQEVMKAFEGSDEEALLVLPGLA